MLIFPSPIIDRKLEVLGWDLGIYLLKVLQSEAANVPFKANFWHWTEIDVSDGLLKPKFE